MNDAKGRDKARIKSNTLYDYSQSYVHEKAYERGANSILSRRISNKRRLVIRRGDTPKWNEKPAYRTVAVTNSQHKAYILISDWCKDMATIHWDTLREVGIREATLKALEKKQLIQVNDGLIRLYKESTNNGI